MLGKPRVTFTEDFYRFDYEAEQVSAVMERIAEKRGAGAGIVCELTIESAEPTAPGVLFSGNFNLLTNNAALANKLTARREDVDWDGLLTQIAGVAKKRYREGEPMVDLATVEERSGSRWVLRGFVEDTTRPTLVAAAGGTGKSTLGAGAALTVATGVPVLGIDPEYVCPVLYMDWEADPAIHAERMRAFWRGIGRTDPLPVALLHYQRLTASMHESASMLRQRIAEEGIRFAVLDSVGMARGGDANESDPTIRLFTANRKLGIPVLAIDHLSKEAIEQPNKRKTAIGSVYTENSVCRLWTMKGAEVEEGHLTVSLTDIKRNNTRQQKPLAYHVYYEHDGTVDERLLSIRYERADFRELPTKNQPGGQKWAMAQAIVESGGRPVPVSELAATLGVSDGQIRRLLSRHDDMFIRKDGGIAIRETEHAE